MYGVAAVGVDAVARLFGDERRGHDPTEMAFLGQIAGEPSAPGTCLLNDDAGCGLGLPLSDELIAVTLARADAAQKDHFGPVILGHVGDRNGLLRDIHADIQGGSVWHG